jgi:flagellar hook-length control protein FliK
VGDSKELNPKGMAKTNTDFAFNTNSSDATNRATLATHDRVEHQTIDTINPMSSTEVAQSQKTNTQLHNETISIFRKDFSEAVKDKVMLMISQKLQQFDITLDPPELGNIHVKVNLQGEQATVNFIVQNQQAKEALDQNMQKLRDMLANQGVDVGDANVEQQSQQSNSNEKGDDTNHRSVTNTAEASDVLEHTLSARMIESSTRGIDYYA